MLGWLGKLTPYPTEEICVFSGIITLSTMLKIIPILIIAMLIALFISFKATQKQQPEDVNIIKTEDSKVNRILVDVSEDYRALGFSGQKKLVLDSKGNVYVAYRKKANNYYEIFVAKLKKDTDGDLSYEVVFKKNVSSINNKVNQRVPSIAIDSKDNLHLVWYGADSNTQAGDRQIKYSSSKDGGETWSKAINISYVSGYKNQSLWQEHPDIWVGNDDNLFVVWEGKDKESDNQYIKFSKSKDGKDWSDWKDINISSGSQSRPTIVQDKNGVLYVFMYSKQNLNNHQIWYSLSSNEGESWSEWKNISNSSQDSRHLSATPDSKNRLHLTWREFSSKNGKTQIMYSSFDKKDWSRKEVVSESNAFQFFPSIGVNKDDTLIISWLETANKSSFPEDDPNEGTSYIATKKSGEELFSNGFLIVKKSNLPSVAQISNSQSFVLFSKVEDNSPIVLTVIDP